MRERRPIDQRDARTLRRRREHDRRRQLAEHQQTDQVDLSPSKRHHNRDNRNPHRRHRQRPEDVNIQGPQQEVTAD